MEGTRWTLFTWLFVVFCICQLTIGDVAQGQSSENVTTTTTVAPSECKKEYTCQECVAIAKCYYCNTNASGYGGCQLYPTSQVFPRSAQCPLSDARWGVCWVNFEAWIITLSVLGGVILLSLGCCVYCCCCKGKSRGNDTHELKWEREAVERQQRHADRRAEREAKMSTIRQKYGLNRDTAAYNRMDD